MNLAEGMKEATKGVIGRYMGEESENLMERID